MDINKDIKYWVGFSRISGIGRVKIAQLESYFGNLEAAWQAAPAELRHAGLDSGSIRSIEHWRPQVSLDAEMEKLKGFLKQKKLL